MVFVLHPLWVPHGESSFDGYARLDYAPSTVETMGFNIAWLFHLVAMSAYNIGIIHVNPQ